MSQAIVTVPFDAHESGLLAGGVPRGYKQLTTATSKLVKAGWLVKGRGGWTATEDGIRAVAAFTDPDQFVNAVISGAPVPDHAPTVVHAPPSPEQLGEEAQAAHAEDPAPPDVDPTLRVSVGAASRSAGDPSSSEDAWQEQPRSVTLSGDFDPLFGEAGHWTTGFRELQLSHDAVNNAWKQTLQLPAGTYQYKIVVDGSWDENYGRFGVRDGDNHELHLLADTTVTSHFDYATKDIRTS